MTIHQTSRTAIIVLVCALCVPFATGCQGNKKTPVDGGSAQEVGVALDAGTVDSPVWGPADSPACPESCDDKNPCTVDSCNVATFQCDHVPVSDETPCKGRACTIGGVCKEGLCYDLAYRTCPAKDPCHADGVCNPATDDCTLGAPLSLKACDDSDPCTFADQCTAGVCAGTPRCPYPLVCNADAGSCENLSGKPVFPSAIAGKTYTNLSSPSAGALVQGAGDKVYLAASISGPSDLGKGPVATNPDLPLGVGGNFKDALFAEIDPTTGSAVWAKPLFGQQDQSVSSFAVNGTGQIGAIGAFRGDFQDEKGNTLLLALTPNDQFVVGVNASDGTWMWGRRVSLLTLNSTTTGLGLLAIAGDPAGSALAVCGTTNKAAADIAKTLVWQGGTDAVVARLDGKTGDTVWSLQIGGVANEACTAIAIDGASNTFVAGSYAWGSAVALPGPSGTTLALPPIPAIQGTWSFLAKVASNGTAAWARNLGSSDQKVLVSMMTALDGDLVIVGTLRGQSGATGLELAGVPLETSLSATGSDTPFLGRLDGNTGAVKWLKALGSEAKIAITGIAPGSNGRLLLAGSYAFAGELGAFPMPEPAAGDRSGAFVAQLDGASGTVLIAKGFGNPTLGSSVLGVASRPDALGDEKDTMLLLVSFLGKMDFGPPLGVVDTGSGSLTATRAAMALVKLAP